MVDFKVLCNADYHQGDEFLFSDLSRGRQCVANCVVFLLTAFEENYSFLEWSKDILHKILHLGDYLYLKIRNVLSETSDFLHPSSIPCHMKFDNVFVHFQLKSTISGSISSDFTGNWPLLSLEIAFATLCSGTASKLMIFICVGTAIGIVFHDSKYYFFDPHARDKFGLPSESGKSILSVLENLSEVCVYLRKFASSLTALKPQEIQYDLHHIVFNKPKKIYCKSHSATNIITVPYKVNCINSVKVNGGQRKRKASIEENVYMCKGKQAIST